MRVALLDLDGTLLDSSAGIFRGLQVGLAAVGVVVDDLEALRPHIGPPLLDSLQELQGLDADTAATALAAYRGYYVDVGLFEHVVYDGVREALAELSRRGWRLGVATSKPETFAVPMLEHAGLADAFEVLAGAELHGGRQRKADVVRHALDQLGVDPGPTHVMVGDREHDVLGAAASGLSSVGVTWGFGDVEELSAAGATVVVDAAEGLPDAVERASGRGPAIRG